MTEILRIYNEIFRPPVAYCVICLRTEHDRRLVALDSFELFLKSCNLSFPFKHELQRVCWVCARRAAAAHRLRQAVSLSHSVHTLFHTLRRDRLCENTFNMLTKTQLKSAEQLAVQVAEVRKSSMLRTTEVLVVSTPPAPPATPATPATPAPHLYVLPDAPPLSPEEEADCVLIKQEDDLTIEETRVQHPPPPAPPPPPPPQVPSVRGNIMTAPCNSDMVAQIVECGNQMLLLQPVLLVPAAPAGGGVQVGGGLQAGGEVQAGAGAASLPALCSSDILSYSIEEEEEEEDEAPAPSPASKRPAAAPAPRPPPQKLAHTDWEDKIPMDIISYIDATDPLAVPAAGAGPGPPRARSPPPFEVIDLC